MPPPSSPTPAQSASVQRAQSALRDFQQRQEARSPAPPQQPTFSVTQRSGSPLPGPFLSSRSQTQDGLLPRTRAQLPRWYITLRQLLLDAYRAVAVVYRIANHVLGSLFEVCALAVPPAHFHAASHFRTVVVLIWWHAIYEPHL